MLPSEGIWGVRSPHMQPTCRRHVVGERAPPALIEVHDQRDEERLARGAVDVSAVFLEPRRRRQGRRVGVLVPREAAAVRRRLGVRARARAARHSEARLATTATTTTNPRLVVVAAVAP